MVVLGLTRSAGARARNGGWDVNELTRVWLQNEYRLPPRFEPDDVIVDIGGHIGAFAHACLVRGAGRVITCEPEPGNLELLRQNLARWGDRALIIPAAVWPSGESTPCLAPPANPYDTCQFSMVFREGGTPVPIIALPEVLDRAGSQVRLLKLDCEGAEHTILPNSKLTRVREVCGEAHDSQICGKKVGISAIIATLGPAWEIEHIRNGPTTDLWWANRSLQLIDSARSSSRV